MIITEIETYEINRRSPLSLKQYHEYCNTRDHLWLKFASLNTLAFTVTIHPIKTNIRTQHHTHIHPTTYPRHEHAQECNLRKDKEKKGGKKELSENSVKCWNEYW